MGVASKSAGQGPSPLARGAHDAVAGVELPGGTIPARAGSTPRSAQTTLCSWDHPRSRGEHVTGIISVAFLLGPSPLARGARGITCGRRS